jgi:putative nucleotidyltransferase with HDIG domain
LIFVDFEMPASDYSAIGLVYDEAGYQTLERLSASLDLHAIPLSTATSDALTHKRAVIVEVDLTEPAKVARLRQLVRQATPGVPLLFCLDRGRHFRLAQVQANALGARGLLHRPVATGAAREALEKLGVTVNPPRPSGIEAAAGGPSIKASARLLEGAFKSLSTGAPLDVRGTLGASRELLSGVGQAGLNAWLDTVRGHHDGTFQHCLLVTGAAVAYALEAKLPPADQLKLTVAALLHDIGKAEIPLDILDKPDRLSDAEFEIVKRHPIIGRDYLLTQDNLPPEVIDAVAHHHEYLDGSGYPDRLAGDQIAPLTRILTVCDVYGALVERRAYKPPKTPYEAIMILSDMARQGKVDYQLVRTLGLAVDVVLRDSEFRLR